MIWLKRHKLVFVKIPKNASEAVSHHLHMHMCRSEDVFTYDNGFGQNMVEPHSRHCHMDARYILGNNLADHDNLFVGVIRHPIERLLSLYLYRQRQRRYNTGISVEDFRYRAKEGFIIDHPWHMQLQSTFLDGADRHQYWSYDKLSTHITELSGESNFKTVNKSIPTKSTQDLIDVFYDDITRRVVHKYWQRDIDLYHEVINAETKLANYGAS
jgi:hypothetical protein